MIRGVCFDLDGTLLRDDHMDDVLVRVAAGVAERHGLTAADVDAVHRRAWTEQWDEIGDEWMVGRVPTDVVMAGVWRRALSQFDVDDLDAAAKDAARLQWRIETAAWTLYPEAIDVLAECRRRGIRTSIITNGPSDLQRAKLDAVELTPHFDAILVSGEVGAQKPDPAIFAAAVSGMGVAADEAIHIGDNQHADVGGARASGLTAVWIDRRGADLESEPHHIVTDLNGLVELLR